MSKQQTDDYLKDKGLSVTGSHTTVETHNHYCCVGEIFYPCPAPTDGSTLIIDGMALECSPELADYPTDSCPLCNDSEFPLLAHVKRETIDLLRGAVSAGHGGYECSLTFDSMELLQSQGLIEDLERLPGRGRYANRYTFFISDKGQTVLDQFYYARERGDLDAIYRELDKWELVPYLSDHFLAVPASDKDRSEDIKPDHSYDTGGVLDGLGLRRDKS